MVAGCLRRIGRTEEALLRYREVYRMAPTNMEALRYLAALSSVSFHEAIAVSVSNATDAAAFNKSASKLSQC